MTYLEKARARLQGSHLAQDEAGLSTVEYVIILVLVAAIAIGTWKTFGESVKTGLTNANTSFGTVTGAELGEAKGDPKLGGGAQKR